jgi:hypothetical protein
MRSGNGKRRRIDICACNEESATSPRYARKYACAGSDIQHRFGLPLSTEKIHDSRTETGGGM